MKFAVTKAVTAGATWVQVTTTDFPSMELIGVASISDFEMAISESTPTNGILLGTVVGTVNGVIEFTSKPNCVWVRNQVSNGTFSMIARVI